MSDSKWKNLWRELFEEEFGVEETERRCQEQFDYPPPGWGSGAALWLKATIAKMLLSLKTYRFGHRIVHAYAVGARGRARILDDTNIPENDFFKPGREFNVTLRHSNALFDDDAMTDGKAAAVRLHYVENDADNVTGMTALDILTLTGTVCPFDNIPSAMRTFRQSVPLHVSHEQKKSVLYERPANLRGILEFFRRGPDSFTHLKYVSHMTYLLETNSGSKHHVRFRLIPEDVTKMADESGLLNEQQQREPWKMERAERDTRSKTYLRDQFREEVSQRELIYHIEIQVHSELYSNKSDFELFNVCKAWDTEKHPWQRLVRLTFDKLLGEEEMTALKFTPGNRPRCLSYPAPRSQYDYNSVPYIREMVYSGTQSCRN